MASIRDCGSRGKDSTSFSHLIFASIAQLGERLICNQLTRVRLLLEAKTPVGVTGNISAFQAEVESSSLLTGV